MDRGRRRRPLLMLIGFEVRPVVDARSVLLGLTAGFPGILVTDVRWLRD